MEWMMDRDDITICCFRWNNWMGEWGVEYVNRLYESVKRRLTLPHRFVCFTDDSHGLNRKIELGKFAPPSMLDRLPTMLAYSPNSGLTGRVFIIDLDTVIVRKIDPFFEFTHPFIVRKAHQKGKYGNSADGIMFDAGTLTKYLWEPLVQNTQEVEQITAGDDRVMYDHYLPRGMIAYWDDLLPRQFVSYPYQVRRRNGKLTQNEAIKRTRMVSFHGERKPHLEMDKRGREWICEHWK